MSEKPSREKLVSRVSVKEKPISAVQGKTQAKEKQVLRTQGRTREKQGLCVETETRKQVSRVETERIEHGDKKRERLRNPAFFRQSAEVGVRVPHQVVVITHPKRDTSDGAMGVTLTLSPDKEEDVVLSPDKAEATLSPDKADVTLSPRAAAVLLSVNPLKDLENTFHLSSSSGTNSSPAVPHSSHQISSVPNCLLPLKIHPPV